MAANSCIRLNDNLTPCGRRSKRGEHVDGRIVKEAERVFFACCEAQEEIVSGSARRTATPFAGPLHGGARR